jgi:diguanylate cyclase (GGDEF)-like protein
MTSAGPKCVLVKGDRARAKDLKELVSSLSEDESTTLLQHDMEAVMAALESGEAERAIVLDAGAVAQLPELLDDPRFRSLRVPMLALENGADGVPAPERAAAASLVDEDKDPVTGLPSRGPFLRMLQAALDRAENDTSYRFALLLLDLDRFKMVNESLGHELGDELLAEIAARLRGRLRSRDAIARLSGDEFSVIIEGVGEADEAMNVTERLHEALGEPFVVSRQEIFTAGSIGIALSQGRYSRAEPMLRDAETAMYRAKSRGAVCEVFAPEMRSRAFEALRLETDLRHALERGEFVLRYQPIVNLRTGQPLGFEALLRWEHPIRGTVSPATFIPLAEETGLIVPIGRWVVEEACRQLGQWRRGDPAAHELFVAVNLSRLQIREIGLAAEVEQALGSSGVPASKLKLEITESMLMQDSEETAATLHRLRELGVGMSLDDFGTGYSSLSCLHRIPIETLKIDRSFVSNIDQDRDSTEIVDTIVTLANRLGKRVIAEGIETTEQLDHLIDLGCWLGQGFLFAAPLAPEEAIRLGERARRRELEEAPAVL